MTISNYVYILTAGLVSSLIRILPALIIQKKIENKYFQSFLYYLPYVTLAVMTFPAMINCTTYELSGILAMIAGILIAWYGGNLFVVAISCCGIVFVAEYICSLIF